MEDQGSWVIGPYQVTAFAIRMLIASANFGGFHSVGDRLRGIRGTIEAIHYVKV